MAERSATTVDKLVAAEIRRRRYEVGMSQERLADMLGVTFQQVQKYEKGTNRVSAGRLWDISVALNHPVAAFYETAVTKLARRRA